MSLAEKNDAFDARMFQLSIKFFMRRTLMENLTLSILNSFVQICGSPRISKRRFPPYRETPSSVPAVGRRVTRNYFRTSSLWEQGLGSLRRGWIMKPSSRNEETRAAPVKSLRSLSQRSSSLQADFRVTRRVSMCDGILSSPILSFVLYNNLQHY